LWEKAAVAFGRLRADFGEAGEEHSVATYEMVRDFLAADLIPKGSLSMLCRGVGDLLSHLPLT